MTVYTEMLLALKAFYVGHAIAEKPGTKPTALAMISAAIQQLQERNSTTDLLRLAFYHHYVRRLRGTAAHPFLTEAPQKRYAFS